MSIDVLRSAFEQDDLPFTIDTITFNEERSEYRVTLDNTHAKASQELQSVCESLLSSHDEFTNVNIQGDSQKVLVVVDTI